MRLSMTLTKMCGHRRGYRCCCTDERPHNEERTLDVVQFMEKRHRTNHAELTQGWRNTEED